MLKRSRESRYEADIQKPEGATAARESSLKARSGSSYGSSAYGVSRTEGRGRPVWQIPTHAHEKQVSRESNKAALVESVNPDVEGDENISAPEGSLRNETSPLQRPLDLAHLLPFVPSVFLLALI